MWTIGAATGSGNDRRMIQITVPAQPANSGGLVLDGGGYVVRIVIARLAQRTGRLPQNVNFAISGATARAFLDAHEIAYKVARSTATLSSVAIAARARGVTVSVECRK